MRLKNYKKKKTGYDKYVTMLIKTTLFIFEQLVLPIMEKETTRNKNIR
jgi:hypothetical protein